MFDVQIKRIHEYKRQLLNILETVALYQAMRARPDNGWPPRVKIFAGKAAAGYSRAKLILKLINDVARVINADAALNGRLKVVFIPNYNVSLARSDHSRGGSLRADLDGRMEASGTGNMKLALQRRTDHRHARRRQHRDPRARGRREYLHLRPHRRRGRKSARHRARRNRGDRRLARVAEVLDAIESGAFSPDDRSRYAGLVTELRDHDYFMVTADFEGPWLRAARHRRPVADQAAGGCHRGAQYGTGRLVFIRPGDSRLRGRDLAHRR
jgi:starch phosphorylase